MTERSSPDSATLDDTTNRLRELIVFGSTVTDRVTAQLALTEIERLRASQPAPLTGGDDNWQRELIDREPDHGQYANPKPAQCSAGNDEAAIPSMRDALTTILAHPVDMDERPIRGDVSNEECIWLRVSGKDYTAAKAALTGSVAQPAAKPAAREIEEILNQLEEHSPNWVEKIRAYISTGGA